MENSNSLTYRTIQSLRLLASSIRGFKDFDFREQSPLPDFITKPHWTPGKARSDAMLFKLRVVQYIGIVSVRQ